MTSGGNDLSAGRGDGADAAPEDAGPAEEERPPVAGPVANLAAAVVVAAAGVAGVTGSAALGVGSPRSPEPGTWPFLISVAVVLLGVALAFTSRRTADAERFSRSSWAVLAGVVTMACFAALVGVIGFEIPSVLLTFVWLRFLGGESWRLSVVTSLAVVAAFYLIFVAALAVPIPHMF